MELRVDGKSERVPPGSHICQLYNKPSEIVGVTAQLLASGLQHNERCLFAGSPQSIEEITQAMTVLCADVKGATESGQLLLSSDRDSMLLQGRFDPYHLLSLHQSFIARSLRDGWGAVRISIDMSWLTKDVCTAEQILKYEAAADAVFTFQNAPIVALMHYDYSRLSGGLVVEMLKLHPIAVVGRFIKRNPYYLNSEQYLLKILRVKKERKTTGSLTNAAS